ncbi:Dam family site-specific DNA-(adenine-N6)-methyltransferase [Dyadobacter sp. CY351]|uniref:DNA adenine methylase n=1 Tax=Dyadobacter sp. CY351 TaxID=2909337 RepID=UPI001F2CFE3F|nr:Dam family site-specific DNA-(adenine-N6)-methyltransferase [Dyadobacter sp. CY351]MCF2521115.1 Dam family site-specific DNA-(adenine-N6)-methyltransferase [Dyadobacter sp. CY351]
MKTIKPFIRFVGGKSWYLKQQIKLFPEKINNYHEPFLGSGSIFFYLKASKLITKTAYLSDINSELITTFQEVKANTNQLVTKLSKLENDRETFYKVRDQRFTANLDKATRFLYLNRTSFGGIYRVNKNGDFNVPYGNRQYKTFIDVENVFNCASILKDETKLDSHCFTDKGYNISENDFFCLDPPYLGENIPFNRYNSKKFGATEVAFLLNLINEINKKNAKYLLFVGDNKELISELHDYGYHQTLSKTNNLSFTGPSRNLSETIIKNY